MLKNFRGFTLIELLVVVAIIGALAAIGTLAYTGYVGGAKKSAATNAMQSDANSRSFFSGYSNDY